MFDHLDLSLPLDDPANEALTEAYVPIYVCPVDLSRSKERTRDLSYVVNAGVGFTTRLRNGVRDCPIDTRWTPLDLDGDGSACSGDPADDEDRKRFKMMGLFFLETWNTDITKRHHSIADIKDGTSQTFMVTENVRAGFDPNDASVGFADPTPYRSSFFIGNPCLSSTCSDGNVDYQRCNAGDFRINSGVTKAEGSSPGAEFVSRRGRLHGVCGRACDVSVRIDRRRGLCRHGESPGADARRLAAGTGHRLGGRTVTSGATTPAAVETAQAPAASQERGGALARIAATVLLIGVAGVALWLRTDHIAEASYWFDESSSWKTISFGWGEMFTPITRNVHPPFFYLALKSWATLFGDAPVSLRMFSATFGVLTVLAAYWLTLEILANIGSLQGDSPRAAGRRLSAGVCAAALLAVSAMQVQAGLNARMYTLGTFLAVVCATHVLRAARTGGTVRDWAVASVTGTMLTLTHYYGLFTAAALGLFLLGSFVFTLWRQGWCGTTKRLAAGMGASAWLAANVWGLWLPYFEAQRGQVTDSYWTPSFNWQQLARTCTVMLSSKEWYGPFGEWMWWVVWLCGLVSLVLFLWGGRGGRLVALAVVVPFVVSIAYSLQGRSVFVLRYFTFAQVFLLIGWAVLTGADPLVVSAGGDSDCFDRLARLLDVRDARDPRLAV